VMSFHTESVEASVSACLSSSTLPVPDL